MKKTAFRGSFDGVDGLTAIGWAWNPEKPEERLTVVIYADGEPVAEGVADQFREDLLQAGIGDGRYGFIIKLPETLADGEEHEISISIKDNNYKFDASPKKVVITSTYQGYIDTITDDLIVFGWVWDKSVPEKRIEIQIIDNEGNILGDGRADQFREDLLQAGIGDGKYGFKFKLVDNILWGKEYTIYATIKETGYVFSKPYTFVPTPKYIGNVDKIDGMTIFGWAFNQVLPNEKVDVQILIDKKFIGTAKANLFRTDLKNEGIGDGSHGFIITLPDSYDDGYEHFLDIFVGHGKYAHKLCSKKVVFRQHKSIDLYHVLDSIYEEITELLVILKVNKEKAEDKIIKFISDINSISLPNVILAICSKKEIVQVINNTFNTKVFAFHLPDFAVESVIFSQLKRLLDRVKYVLIIDISSTYLKIIKNSLLTIPHNVGLVCFHLHTPNKESEISSSIETWYYRLANKSSFPLDLKIPRGSILVRSEILYHLIASYITAKDISNSESVYAYLSFLCETGGFKVLTFEELLEITYEN